MKDFNEDHYRIDRRTCACTNGDVMDGLYRIDRRTCACTNGVMMDDLYLIDRRTCACTNSSNQRKKMEKRLPNSSADPCATSPIPSSRICSRRSFPTLKTDACLVTRFDVACVTSRCGKTNGAYRNTSVRIRGVYAQSIQVACTTRRR